MEVKKFGTNNEVSVAVTVMRRGDLEGRESSELLDGNTIPRLCKAFGEGACAQACLLMDFERPEAGVMCAENNISNALESFGVAPENFILAAATTDNVFFGDSLDETSVFESSEGYSQLPEANAFFFRPGIDKGPNGMPINAMGMRMADCGSVNYEFKDRQGNLVLGQSHFSRTNMHGPSAFNHEVAGKKVSWAEHVLASAIEHYGADTGSIRIYLAAAVEGKDFIHNFDSDEKMNKYYKGWSELGFMHRDKDTGETLIDYREMIMWQLEGAAEAFGVNKSVIKTEEAINTGDINLGHASHQLASKGKIEHGRDMYIVGVSESSRLETPETDIEDPFVTLYELHMGHAAPPKELWDTEQNRASAEEDGYHPMAYWLMGSDYPADEGGQKLYDQWMKDISERQL